MKIRDRVFLILATLLVAATSLHAETDPPGRVGRISYVEGGVGFRVGYEGVPEPAQLNWPVTTDNFVATDGSGRAEIRIGSTAIRIDRGSELEFAQLDDQQIRLRLLQGSVTLRIRSREQAAELQLATPEGLAYPLEPGSYRIDSGRGAESTVVEAFQGSVRFDGDTSSLTLSGGQRLEFWGSQSMRTAGARQDEFDAWSLARDRLVEAHPVRYVSSEMTGYEELDSYGYWRETPDYGAVWYPRVVPVGWAPYRWGHWAWILPWGWTWVDDQPWGFAPFHYGRWLLVGASWCWVPGRVVPRPVYAPALVAWIGQSGWNVSIGVGAMPAVGWFPLAPREVYYPAFASSPTYIRNVNVTHVTHIDRFDRPPDHYAYRHAERAVTVVPEHVMSDGRSVGHAFVPFRDSRELGKLPPPVTAPLVVPRPRRGLPDEPRRNADGTPRMPAARPGVPPTLVRPAPGRDEVPPAGYPQFEPSRPGARTPGGVPTGDPRSGTRVQQVMPSAVPVRPGEGEKAPAPVRRQPRGPSMNWEDVHGGEPVPDRPTAERRELPIERRGVVAPHAVETPMPRRELPTVQEFRPPRSEPVHVPESRPQRSEPVHVPESRPQRFESPVPARPPESGGMVPRGPGGHPERPGVESRPAGAPQAEPPRSGGGQQGSGQGGREPRRLPPKQDSH